MDLEKVVLKAKFYRYPVAGADRARRQAGPRLGPIALTTNQGHSGAQCQPRGTSILGEVRHVEI